MISVKENAFLGATAGDAPVPEGATQTPNSPEWRISVGEDAFEKVKPKAPVAAAPKITSGQKVTTQPVGMVPSHKVAVPEMKPTTRLSYTPPMPQLETVPSHFVAGTTREQALDEDAKVYAAQALPQAQAGFLPVGEGTQQRIPYVNQTMLEDQYKQQHYDDPKYAALPETLGSIGKEPPTMGEVLSMTGRQLLSVPPSAIAGFVNSVGGGWIGKGVEKFIGGKLEPQKRDQGQFLGEMAEGLAGALAFYTDMQILQGLPKAGAAFKVGEEAASRLGRFGGEIWNMAAGNTLHNSAAILLSSDKWRNTYKSFLEGAEMGAAFAGLKTVFPVSKLKRVVAGWLTFDALASAQSGKLVHPFDKRTIREKAQSYLTTSLFLAANSPKELELIKAEKEAARQQRFADATQRAQDIAAEPPLPNEPSPTEYAKNVSEEQAPIPSHKIPTLNEYAQELGYESSAQLRRDNPALALTAIKELNAQKNGRPASSIEDVKNRSLPEELQSKTKEAVPAPEPPPGEPVSVPETAFTAPDPTEIAPTPAAEPAPAPKSGRKVTTQKKAKELPAYYSQTENGDFVSSSGEPFKSAKEAAAQRAGNIPPYSVEHDFIPMEVEPGKWVMRDQKAAPVEPSASDLAAEPTLPADEPTPEQLSAMEKELWQATEEPPQSGERLTTQAGPEEMHKVQLWEMSPKELGDLREQVTDWDNEVIRQYVPDPIQQRKLKVALRKGTGEDLAASIHPDLVQKLFYDDVPDTEVIGDYLDAWTGLDLESPQAMGRSLAKALTDVGDAVDPSTMTHSQQVAHFKLRQAFEYAKEQGWDTKEVSGAALKAAARRFSDPADAEFMLSRYMKSEETPTRLMLESQAGPNDPTLPPPEAPPDPARPLYQFRQDAETTRQQTERFSKMTERDRERMTLGEELEAKVNEVNRVLDGDGGASKRDVIDWFSDMRGNLASFKDEFPTQGAYWEFETAFKQADRWVDGELSKGGSVKLRSGIDLEDIQDALGFFSKAGKLVMERMKGPMSREQFGKWLQNQGVSPQELDVLKLGEWPARVTVEDAKRLVGERIPKFEERVLGEPQVRVVEYPASYAGARNFEIQDMQGNVLEHVQAATPEIARRNYAQGQGINTFYPTMTLPGGENYREILWQKEGEPAFQGGHWTDKGYPNVMGHARVKDYGKTTVVQELQMDWAKEAAKDEGVAPPPMDVKKGTEFGVKRLMRGAAERGQERLAFPSTPEQVAQIEGWAPGVEWRDGGKIPEWIPIGDGIGLQLGEVVYKIRPTTPGEAHRHGEGFVVEKQLRNSSPELKNISDTLQDAKEYVERFYGATPGTEQKAGYFIRGTTKNVTGLINTYTKHIPNFLKEQAKKWGTETGEMEIDTGSGKEPVTYIKLNPEQAKVGVSLYANPIVPFLDAAQKVIAEGTKKLTDHWRKDAEELSKKSRDTFLRRATVRWLDTSGNLVNGLDSYGKEEAQRASREMQLVSGSPARVADVAEHLNKAVWKKLDRKLTEALENLVAHRRIVSIGKYDAKFKNPRGITPGMSEIYVNNFEAAEGLTREQGAQLRGMADTLFDQMRANLKKTHDAGIIGDVVQIGKFEVPYTELLKHDYMPRLPAGGDVPKGKGFGKKGMTVRDTGIVRLSMGSAEDTLRLDARNLVIESTASVESRIARNDAQLAMNDLALVDKTNPFVRVGSKGKKAGVEAVPKGWIPEYFYRDGKRHKQYFNPEYHPEWLVKSTELSGQIAAAVRTWSGSNLIKQIMVGLNPAFALPNFLRDTQHIYFTAMYKSPVTGEWKSAYSVHPFLAVPQMAMDIGRVARDAWNMEGRWKDALEEGLGFEGLVQNARGSGHGYEASNHFKTIADALSFWGRFSETLTRLSTRERIIRDLAKEKGISFEEAYKNKEIRKHGSFVGREYFDLQRGGSWTRALDTGIPFFKAGMRGTYSMWRAARRNPRDFAIKVAYQMAMSAGLQITAQTLFPKIMAGISDGTKERNHIIPISEHLYWTDDQNDKHYLYFKIPKNPGTMLFSRVAEFAVDRALGIQTDPSTIVKSLMNTISPVNDVSSLAPPIWKAYTTYVTNTDTWSGDKIWEGLDGAAPWTEYKPTTPMFWRKIGELTKNPVTGMGGISPERGMAAAQELLGNNMFTQLMGLADQTWLQHVPEGQRKHMTLETIQKYDPTRRFIGTSNPSAARRGVLDDAKEKVNTEQAIKNNTFNELIRNTLRAKDRETATNKLFEFMAGEEDQNKYKQMMADWEFAENTRDLPHRSWWLSMIGESMDVKAETWLEMVEKTPEEEKDQLFQEAAQAKLFSPQFDEALARRQAKAKVEVTGFRAQ